MPGIVFTLRIFQPFMGIVPLFHEALSSIPLKGPREKLQMCCFDPSALDWDISRMKQEANLIL